MSKLDTHRIDDDDISMVRQEGTLPTKTVLQQRYEILAVQGIGGMGAVYQARDLRFGAVSRIVAVKEMMNNTQDPRLRQLATQNFEREANILASLSHPAIPKIFDIFTEGNRSYLVLEFVYGQTLEDLLGQRRKPFSQDEVLDWAFQVCDVLAYLHQHKPPVIFRDVKPDNLMLRTDGRIMVIDFGIAKVFEQGQRGTMIGTEGYSPPEQYRGVVDARGDIYALGATLHHLLTARDPRMEPPFTFHERPIQVFNPGVSAELQTVITKSLAYNVEDRYASAAELAQALAGLSPGRVRTTPFQDTAAPPGLVPQSVTPKWVFKCEDEVRSSPRVLDAMVYVGCYDNNLYALEAQSGNFVWKYAAEGGIVSTPAFCEGNVLFGSEDQKLYAVSSRTGQLSWTCQASGPIRSSPRVEYGHVFFGADDGCLYAANAQSGRVVWRFQSAGPIRSTPLLVGEVVFVGSEDGFIYAVEMRTGNVKWKYNTNRRITSSPCISEPLIFFGSADGHVYALNAGSGWLIWRFRTKGGVLSSPALANDLLYAASVDNHLYCLDIRSGRQIWKYDAGSSITSSPAVADGVVYVGSNDGTVHAVEARLGRSHWRYVTGGPVPSSPTVANATVYIGSNDHRLYALPA